MRVFLSPERKEAVFDLCDTFPTKLMLPEDPLPCFFGDTGRRVILTVLANTQLFKASDFRKPWGLPKCQTLSQGGIALPSMPLCHGSQHRVSHLLLWSSYVPGYALQLVG